MNPNSLIDVPQCSSQPHQSDYENNMSQQQLINHQLFDDQFDLKNQENMKDCQNLDFPSDSTYQIPKQSRTSQEPNKTANDPHGQNRQVVDGLFNTAYPKKKIQGGDGNQSKKQQQKKQKGSKQNDSVHTKSLPSKLIRYFMKVLAIALRDKWWKKKYGANSQIQLEVPQFIKNRMKRVADWQRSQKLSKQHITQISASKLIEILEGVKKIQDITFDLYKKYCSSQTFKSSIVNIFILFFQRGPTWKYVIKVIFNWDTICNTFNKTDPIFKFEPEIRMMIYQYQQTGIAPLGTTVLQVKKSIKSIKSDIFPVISPLLNKNKAANKKQWNEGFQQEIRKQFKYINKQETSYLLKPMINQLLDSMEQLQKSTDPKFVQKSFNTYLDKLYEKIQKFQQQFSKQNKGTTSDSGALSVQQTFFKSLLTLCGFIRTLDLKGRPCPSIAALSNFPTREKKKRNTSKQSSIEKSSTDTRSLTKKQMKTMKKMQKNSISNNIPVSPHAESSNLQTQVEKNLIEGLKPLKKVKLSNSQEKETTLPQSRSNKILNKQLLPGAVSAPNLKRNIQQKIPQEKILQQKYDCQKDQRKQQMVQIESKSDNQFQQQIFKDTSQKKQDFIDLLNPVVRNLSQEQEDNAFSQLGNSKYQDQKTKQIGAQQLYPNEVQEITNSLFDYQQPY